MLDREAKPARRAGARAASSAAIGKAKASSAAIIPTETDRNRDPAWSTAPRRTACCFPYPIENLFRLGIWWSGITISTRSACCRDQRHLLACLSDRRRPAGRRAVDAADGRHHPHQRLSRHAKLRADTLSDALCVEARAAHLSREPFRLLLSGFVLGPWATSLALRAYFSDGGTYAYVVSNFTMIDPTRSLPGVWFTKWDAGGVVDGPLWTLPCDSRCTSWCCCSASCASICARSRR